MILTKMKLGLTVLAIMAAPTAFGQGVPTIDVTSIAKLQEMIAEQKLQLREQIAQNVKLDEQTLKLVEQIRTLEAQLDALRNGLSLADLGLDPASFLRDILPDFSDLSKSLDAAEAVMNPDWSSARKTTQRAISSGSPSRPTGICGTIRSARIFASIARTISVPI